MAEQTDARAPAARIRGVAVVATMVAVVAWGALGLRTGVTLDSDTRLLGNAFASVLAGAYEPSRTSGFPLYEFGGAALWSVTGNAGLQVAALLLTVVALLLLLRPTRALRSWLGLLCWVCLALCPSVLTNASAVMETPLLLALLATLAWILSHPRPDDTWVAPALAACAAGLVLTRPDSLIVVAATLVGLAVVPVAGRRRLVLALGGGAVAGLVVVALVTGRFPFRPDYLLNEPLARRLSRGVVGVSTVFSPVGAIAVVALGAALVLAALVLWRSRPPSREGPLLGVPAFCAAWLLVTLGLYGARYLVLPDEVEYLLPAMVVLAVSVPGLVGQELGVARALGAVVLVGLLSTSVVTVAFAQRTDPWQLSPEFRVSVQPGGALQDLRAREALAVRNSEDYRLVRREALGPLAAQADLGVVVVRARDRWYQLASEKYDGAFGSASLVAGCRQLDGRDDLPGWRLSQPASAYTDVETYAAGRPLECGVVALLGPDTVTVEPLGATPLAPAGTVFRR